MKRYALLGALIATGVIACTPPTPPPTPQACTVVGKDASSSVTSTLTPSAPVKALDPNNVQTLGTDVYVDDPTNALSLKSGDVIASDCNEGLLRKVTSASAQTTGVSGAQPLGIRKVYIQTADASLEDVVSDGDATINYGDMPITNQNTTNLAPGARVQDLTATLTIKDFKVPVSVGSLTFNGSVNSSLNPVFKLSFAGGKVKSFEASLTGSLKLNISSTLQATVGGGVGKEAQIWAGSYTRAFLLGGIPMVVVIEPKLLAGANVSLNGTASLTAGIAPSFSTGFGVKYDGATKKWSSVGTAPTFALNPTFDYSAKTNGTASAYVRFIIGVKFYGVAGPTIEAKPSLDLTLFPSASEGAKLTASVLGSVGVQAGFKALGAGLAVAYTDTLFDPKTLFTCKYSGSAYTCS